MNERIPWDKYEAAILLDTFLSVEENLLTRGEAFEYISAVLRQRASINGLLVNDNFRNVNGIRMQMDSLKFIYSNGERGLSHANKLFNDIVELYQTDRSTYRTLLEEANKSAGLLLYQSIPHRIR
ncbi:hypothetical protein RFF05_03975 [Bengtsoniella intestinalis]|uniref:hypothetical protein n=1 Tax=Bengtsoniella intestinalis TaxID=3073143 RepID=UPI00391F7F9A